MIPVALLGKLAGLQVAMVVARLLTAVATGANAVLAAMCVRHRGPAAMAAAGLLLACWPLAPAADRTLFLEPHLVLFFLLGVLAMFPKGQPAEGRRMMPAGAAFGFAATVNIWAVLVIAIALATCLGRRKAALNLGKGIAVGFGVPVPALCAAGADEFFQTGCDRSISAPDTGKQPGWHTDQSPRRPHGIVRIDRNSRHSESGAWSWSSCSARRSSSACGFARLPALIGWSQPAVWRSRRRCSRRVTCTTTTRISLRRS